MKNKFLSLILIVMFGLANLVSADIGDEYGCRMYGMMVGSFGYGGMFFGWLFSILVIVALILLIVWLIKQIQKK